MNRCYVSYVFFLFFYLWSNVVYSVSIVYNLRVAHITKEPITIGGDADERLHTLIGLLFDQYRIKYCKEIHQNFAGFLGSYAHRFWSNWYVRTDAAVAHIKETTAGITTVSDTKPDDILISLGRNSILNNAAIITFTGIIGIPTHRIFTLQHVDFGYAQVGLGFQFDGTYSLADTWRIFYAARYVYFIPRHALDDSCKYHEFTVGNRGDILLSLKKSWVNHGLEGGWSERWQFGAQVYPNSDIIVAKSNHTRSNFYLVYNYDFLICDVKNKLLFNISYGFDTSPKLFGNKSIINAWFAWNINF